jgi:hypothetical protein
MAKNNKKQIINDIVNELIKINVFEYKNMQDKKVVDYNCKNHQTVNAVIKKCSGLCLRDWDYSILRDQTYASVFEAINKIANNYTEAELKLIYSDIHTKKQTITNQFLAGVYKKSIFDVKSKLSGHRKDGKSGMIPAHNYVEYTEENLQSIIEVSDEEQQLDIIFFISWFNQNKENFLTKKQLEFLEDPNITKTNKCTYRKRIFENTMKAYQQEFDNCENDRLNEIESQIKTIEKILEAEDFAAAYIKHRNKQFIIDAVIKIDLEILKAFNSGYRSYDKVIKPMRIALFNKLDELNNLLATLK